MPKKKSGGNKPPPYYNAKLLTIGMLEDVCRNVQNKSLPVVVVDRNGKDQEEAIKVMLLARNRKVTGLTIVGGFNWSINPAVANDDDEGDPDEDMDENMTTWDMLSAYGGQQPLGPTCSIVDKEAGDCVTVDGSKLVYLGDLPAKEAQNAIRI